MADRSDPLENLSRIVADDYVSGREELPIHELRARGNECQEVAAPMDVLRRLVQGRLDIVHADLQRRAGGLEGDLGTFVEQLPAILSEGRQAGTVPRRLPPDLSPDVNYRLLTADLDRIMDADTSAGLMSMSDDEVRRIADELEELERRVSRQRGKVHEHSDRLQAEVVRRYKSGEARPDDLLRA